MSTKQDRAARIHAGSASLLGPLARAALRAMSEPSDGAEPTESLPEPLTRSVLETFAEVELRRRSFPGVMGPFPRHHLEAMAAGAERLEPQSEIVRHARRAGAWTFLTGPPGTGKTTAACELAARLATGETARYWTWEALVDQERELVSVRASDAPPRPVLLAMSCGGLVLDDLRAPRTEWESDLLGTLLDGLYQGRRTLIAVTNLGREGLAKALGERLVSRAAERGRTFEFAGVDHRVAAGRAFRAGGPEA